MTHAKDRPGTERHRDEARSGGPRMHGMPWHDHEEAHDIDRVGHAHPEGMAGADERQGMGKRGGRKDKGSTRVDNPPGRGKGLPGMKSRR